MCNMYPVKPTVQSNSEMMTIMRATLQHGLKFCDITVQDFTSLWSRILIPLFLPFTTSSDKSGETTCLASQLPPLSCYNAHHSQLSEANTFFHYMTLTASILMELRYILLQSLTIFYISNKFSYSINNKL